MLSKSKLFFTFLTALAAGRLFLELSAPLPWLLGPLITVGLLSVCGAPVVGSKLMVKTGQVVMGVFLGLTFTPLIFAQVLHMWWAILLSTSLIVMAGWVQSLWLWSANHQHMPDLGRSTVWFSSAIGAANEMTMMSEKHTPRTDLVAAAHSMRMLLVSVTIPFTMQFLTGINLSELPPSPVAFSLKGFALILAIACIAAYAVSRTRISNPWFLGPVLVTTVLAGSGLQFSSIPAPVIEIAQVILGISLGVRFKRSFVTRAPRWLLTVAIGTFGLMFMCAVYAYILAHILGIDPLAMSLAVSPGGITEMALTAQMLGLGVPVVIGFQLFRMVIVLLVTEPLFAWLYGGESKIEVQMRKSN